MLSNEAAGVHHTVGWIGRLAACGAGPGKREDSSDRLSQFPMVRDEPESRVYAAPGRLVPTVCPARLGRASGPPLEPALG